MIGTLIGYARVSTNDQDITTEKNAPAALGVGSETLFTDQGLTRREVKLSIGGFLHDPTHPVGRLLFDVLAMVAEYEADLIRARTREGVHVAKAVGRLRGKQPKLFTAQEKYLLSVHKAGEHTTTEIAELFGVASSAVYRAIQRAGYTAARAFIVQRSTERMRVLWRRMRNMTIPDRLQSGG